MDNFENVPVAVVNCYPGARNAGAMALFRKNMEIGQDGFCW
jgi:hypothetical protein